MKKLLVVLTIVLSNLSILAQSPRDDYEVWKQQQKQSYVAYRNNKQEDYNAWRKKVNQDYAQWLEAEWKKYSGNEARPIPQEPKPPQPKVAPPEKIPVVPFEVPYEEVIPIEPLVPVPPVPLPDVEDDEYGMVTVQYYHTPVKVRLGDGMKIHLNNVSGKELAMAWEKLSDGRCEKALKDCLKIKETLSLSDWGFVQLLRCVAKEIYMSECNEAKLFEEWALIQTGYQVRLASTEKGRLYLMMPFDERVFDMSWLEIEGIEYYVIGCKSKESFMVMDKGVEGESIPSLGFKQLPQLSMYESDKRTITSTKYPLVSIRVSENKNLIEYMNDYPKVAGSWHVYANASLSGDAKNQIYPKLREKLQGKSDKLKVDILLNLVQTGLNYEYDEKQFGGERSLFADETLYYPSCDCEDRSILFSVLVKDLVGLDVVLLHFPRHLATAVHFDTNVDGDFLDIDGKKYIICDPTYIGAPVGMAMPECMEEKVRVFKL